MGKYTGLIKQARKLVNQEASKKAKPAPEPIDETVNLSIKVAAVRRRHWVAEAKREGTTITSVIIEALSNRFGEPD